MRKKKKKGESKSFTFFSNFNFFEGFSDILHFFFKNFQFFFFFLWKEKILYNITFQSKNTSPLTQESTKNNYQEMFTFYFQKRKIK